ncbi:hypothetical protein B566_EDAN013926 [Ephemera danica]|nr:hypothetical protein B566_EDAN013926 [Ephemera danica]
MGLDWVQFPAVEESKSDLGPHLSRLPEELLPAIGRFLINSDHSSKKLIKCENIRHTHELVRCLIILSRNFDNIPFIASCDFVGLLVGFAAAIIHQLVEGEVAEFQFTEEAKGFVTRVCRLLECLYDPYFSWRAFLQEKTWTKTQLPFQPALLHVEVIPFLYDCFETCISTVAPELSSELIHVLGAVVSGAQNVAVWLAPSEQPEKLETAPKEEGHNGLRAICPATVNMVVDSVVAAQSSPGLRCVSLRCFVAMRQIEVGTMFQQFRDAMHDLADFVWAPPRSEPSTPDVAKQVSLDPASPAPPLFRGTGV